MYGMMSNNRDAIRSKRRCCRSALLTLTLAVMSCTALFAGKPYEPYRFYNYFEVSYGPAFFHKAPSAHDRHTTVFCDGNNIGQEINLRYMHFCNRHWGFQAQLNLTAIKEDDDAVSMKYIQIPAGTDILSELDESLHDVMLMQIQMGAVYRHTWGCWTLQPSLSAGISFINDDMAQGTFVMLRQTGTNIYGSLSNESDNHDEGFALMPAIQMAYSIRNRCFFFVEAAYNINFGLSLSEERTLEWQDVSETTITERHSQHMPASFAIRLGIGLHLGVAGRRK